MKGSRMLAVDRVNPYPSQDRRVGTSGHSLLPFISQGIFLCLPNLSKALLSLHRKHEGNIAQLRSLTGCSFQLGLSPSKKVTDYGGVPCEGRKCLPTKCQSLHGYGVPPFSVATAFKTPPTLLLPSKSAPPTLYLATDRSYVSLPTAFWVSSCDQCIC